MAAQTEGSCKGYWFKNPDRFVCVVKEHKHG